MSNEPDISDLIARAKAGDETAIREFLTRFEPEVRIMVRGRLPRMLRTQFDSMDFVQAVWQSFFADLRSSSRQFENVHHLRGFLAGVARNKVYEEHRRLTRTKKHALAREQSLYVRRGSREVELALISPEPTASQAVQASDRLAQLVARCSPLEVQVITLRRQEMTFDEIARRTGVSEALGPADHRRGPRADGGQGMAVIPWRAQPTASQDAQVPGERMARRDSLDGDQGRSRRPGGASSRLLPFEVLPVASTVIREPSHRAGLPAELTSRSVGYAAGSISREHQAALDDFTERLARGEISNAEAYLARLGQVAPALAVELIYREYCLAELAGSQPDPAVFLDRFPAHREMLGRLFSVHRACSSSQLEYWIEPTAGAVVFPEAGDEIGPYLLRRETRARGLCASLPGRAGRPGKPAGDPEAVNEANPRAMAAGPGTAFPHRRDPVACRGR